MALEMEDGGRPQDLDLRTGERTRAASPLYYPVPTAPIGSSAVASWSPDKAPGLRWYGNVMSISIDGGDNGSATLAPYVDGRRWAPPGRVWLLVYLQMSPAYDDNWGFRADVSRSFSVVLPGGRNMAASGTASYRARAGESSPPNVSLVFSVPSTLRTFTLRFTPTGTLYPPYHLRPIPVGAVGRSAGTMKIRIRR